MTKKKILFINGHLKSGGVEKSLVDILRAINTEKFDVSLLLLEGFGDYFDYLPSSVHVRLVDLHNTYGSFILVLIKCIKRLDWTSFVIRILMGLERIFGLSVWKLLKFFLFKTEKYDCVIGFRPGICTYLSAYSVNATCRIGWWHHGEFILSSSQTKFFSEACKHLNRLVTVSNGCKKMISEKCPELENKLYVIPNMIDIQSIIQKSQLFSVYYNKRKGEKIFVSVGRLSKEKHIENVIYAAEKLKNDSLIKFHWYVVGDGEERIYLENLIHSTRTNDVVTLLGNKSNPYPYIKEADVLVHTSHVESQCLVVLEAMALQTLCIVTRSLGVEEFVVDGYNAILVEQNLTSLLQGIYKTLHCFDDQIIMNGLSTVQLFSRTKIYAQFEKLIDSNH